MQGAVCSAGRRVKGAGCTFLGGGAGDTRGGEREGERERKGTPPGSGGLQAVDQLQEYLVHKKQHPARTLE